MASGVYHQLATIAAAAPAGVVAYSIWGDVSIATTVTAGVLFGLLVHPDRDLRVTKIDFDMAKWSLGLGLLWAVVWWPYSSAIPRHRHWLSHLPAVGTAGRVAYLALLIVILSFMLPSYPLIQTVFYHPLLWFGVLGLFLSDLLHWLMDGMPLF